VSWLQEGEMDIYCTQLGMVVDISYCVAVNEGLPCRNLIGCWKDRTDIGKLLKESFTEEEIRKAFHGLPKSKIERILESVRRARE
jgi:hypothetical protein